MNNRFLLDTNILSDLVRNPQGQVTLKIRHHGEDSVCTSIIVAAELRYGAAKKGSPRLSNRVQDILELIDIVPFDRPADGIYRDLRSALEQTGNLIGPNDILIAAQCLALDLTLVTANELEFSQVAGLKTENWLKP